MEVDDIFFSEPTKERFNNHLIRGLIVGKSGCSKTTLLFNLLFKPGWLDYDNLRIFGKSLFQYDYQLLKKAFEAKLPKECILRLFNMRDEIKNSLVPSSIVIQE